MSTEYFYQLVVNLIVSLQFVVAGLFFLHPLQKRSYYPLRFLLAFLVCAAVYGIATYVRILQKSLLTRIFMRVIQISLPLVISAICYEAKFTVRIKTWCSGVAAMEIGAGLYALFLAIFQVDERSSIRLFSNEKDAFNWIIYILFRLLIYWLLYWVLARKRPEEHDRTGRRSTIILATTCLFFLVIPVSISNEYRTTSYPMYLVSEMYLVLLNAFILAICTSIEFQSRYRRDMEIMDEVIREERKQYQQMKESMEVINLRCHDLKHQLDDFSGKLTERELDSLRDAMDFYDSNIKTGCEVLDVVLHTKQLIAKEAGIEITCLADGACLRFIRTRHLYSLFNNAISNAIEAVQKLDDPQKRVVAITVERQKGNAVIEVSNYFNGVVPQSGETTKADYSHHGFGTMSMRYIAKSYGGQVSVNTEGQLYVLTITIPIP